MTAFPDTEGAVRAWLRSAPDVSALVGQRVFFGVPKGATEATFPLVVVQRVGGGDDPSEAPVDIALVQLDCWGGIDDSGNGRKAQATALVNAVRSAAADLRSPITPIPNVVLHGVNVESVVWLPDADNDRPRYVVTAEVTAISS